MSTGDRVWNDEYNQDNKRIYTGVRTALEALFTDTENWVDPTTGALREPVLPRPRPALSERIGRHAMNFVGAIDERVTKLASRALGRWI